MTDDEDFEARLDEAGVPGDDTLAVDDVSGLTLPFEFIGYDGGLVIRTPKATIEHDPGMRHGPFDPTVEPAFFGGDEPLAHPELAPDKVSFQKEGGDPQVYTVRVSTDADGADPDSRDEG